MKAIRILVILVFIVGFNLIWSQSVARWYTSMGDFEVTLREDYVPITVDNFVTLTNTNFYDELIFHRVIADFMIQDGCPYGTGYGGPGYTIPDEFHPLLNFNEPYTIGMANTGQPNSAGSQYFITVEPTTWLNGGYAVFGHVTLGSDIVEDISEVPTDANDKPIVDVEIDSIRIMTPQFYAFTPEEDSLYVNAGDPMVFGLLSNETGLTYNWYVNDELQIDNDFLFNVSLTVNGWNEIKAVVSNGEYDYIKIWWVEVSGGTGTNNIITSLSKLYQNIPNPFNPSTTISFNLTAENSEYTELIIYNLKGQLIKTLISEQLGAGEHNYVWNGTDNNDKKVTSGIYLYKLTSGNYSKTRKALMLK